MLARMRSLEAAKHQRKRGGLPGCHADLRFGPADARPPRFPDPVGRIEVTLRSSNWRSGGVWELAGHPPSGTVTFLLTDLEGSTRLWEQDPEAMKAAMARHDEILDKTIAAHRGFVFA